MLKKLLLYLRGFQRYEFYNVNLLGSTISRKTPAKFIDIIRNPRQFLFIQPYIFGNY